VWDSRGWTPLGEEWIEGGRDDNFIAVRTRDRGYTKLLVAVLAGEVEMNDVIVEYPQGGKDRLRVREVLRAGSRPRSLDLPRRGQPIDRVELKARPLGGPKAKVQVWAR